MAGIGFSLRKILMDEDSYSTKVKAWFHTAIVAAGPWIISIITINMLLYFSREWDIPYSERELLIASIIYATLFSQILSAPFQMLITRYIADRIYLDELDYIKPSFWGLSTLVAGIALVFSLVFFNNKPLPVEFKYIATTLFILLSVLWILVVYLSTMKNFQLITFANLLGAVFAFFLFLFFSKNPLPFSSMEGAINLLMAYTGGMFLILLFLLVVFMAELKDDNGKVFHFIRYFHSVPSLWPIGLFYTAAIWVDNIIMWFSPIGIRIYDTYQYAPFYDIASFYAYLTILPSIMLFMVLIETDFYIKCREFYLAVLQNSTYKEMKTFAERMRRSLLVNILQTFEVQLFITLLLIAFSRNFFPLLRVPEEAREIFKIYALGSLCNSFVLIFMQVLLYIGERNKTLILLLIFFFSNIFLTIYFSSLGEAYYGFGFFLSAFITMVLGFFQMLSSYKRVIAYTFMTQPLFVAKKEKFFEKIERYLDTRFEKRVQRDAERDKIDSGADLL